MGKNLLRVTKSTTKGLFWESIWDLQTMASSAKTEFNFCFFFFRHVWQNQGVLGFLLGRTQAKSAFGSFPTEYQTHTIVICLTGFGTANLG